MVISASENQIFYKGTIEEYLQDKFQQLVWNFKLNRFKLKMRKLNNLIIFQRRFGIQVVAKDIDQ